jgi:ATP-dependent DNA helicase RecG
VKFIEEDRERLDKLGVKTPLDLSLIIPHRYEDLFLSSSIEIGYIHTFKAKVINRAFHPKFLKLKLYLISLNREIEAIIFNPRRYHSEKLKEGSIHYLHGKVEFNFNSLTMMQPKIVEEVDRILPIYKTRLQNKTVINLIKKYITKESMLKEGLDEKKWEMLESIHFPDREFVKEFQREGFSKESLMFLKYLEIFNHLKKLSNMRVTAKAKRSFHNDITPFLNSLPFKLTGDQLRAIEDIREDLKRDIAAKRVIMGDVGSGKSMVIFASVMLAKRSRSALMAPTTVLARQLYEEAKKYLSDFVKVGLVTNTTKKDEDLDSYDFIIGTHALLHRDFGDVDLVMVDEQHRFGTKQRAKIAKMVSSRERAPHYLQFTATPIPRTLSMIQSSLVDISVIKEMPFKKDIDTRIVTKKDFDSLIEHIKSEISKDRQVIVVYPLVNESEAIDYQSIDEAKGWWQKNFDKLYVTHGKDRDKEDILERFREDGEILLATTLIEVGISLPRLSTIVLVAPERLGLSTLHQLRGRVSRNGLKGYCFLYTKTPDNKRLQDFSKTLDGFEIAELDLKYRESGDLLRGDIQSGKHFKWFDPRSDMKILEYAKRSLNLVAT